MANPTRRAYLLPMTLLLLAISAVALAGACRLSLNESLSSLAEVNELQRRWGEFSCQSTLLPLAEQVIASAPANSPAASATLTLGGQRFELTFADEQAKVDATALYAREGRSAVERLARDAARGGSGRLLARVRPLRNGAIRSLGQLFVEARDAGPESAGPIHGREPIAASIRAASSRLTCWGGALNWKRATPAAIERCCQRTLGPGDTRQLIAARDQGTPLAQAMLALQWPPEKIEAAQTLLIDRSDAYSLWIVARWPGGSAYRLAVSTKENGARPVVYAFCW